MVGAWAAEVPVVVSCENLFDGDVYLSWTSVWTIAKFKLIPMCLAEKELT